MAVINHAKREINAKIVIYGAAGSGKGALLSCIHQRIKPSLCSPLKTMTTGGDTLLFFDYAPFAGSDIDGYRICFHLYTLSGAVKNPGTWKMLLKGVDGLMLVAGAAPQSGLTMGTISSLRTTLGSYGRDFDSLPAVMLLPESDGPDGTPTTPSECAELPTFTGSGSSPEGALSALAELSRRVMAVLRPAGEAAPSEPGEPQPITAVSARKREDDESSTHAGSLPLPIPVLTPGHPATVRIPVVLSVDGVRRSYTLSATLVLEAGEED